MVRSHLEQQVSTAWVRPGELRVPGGTQNAADSGAERDAALEAADTWQVAEQLGMEWQEPSVLQSRVISVQRRLQFIHEDHK